MFIEGERPLQFEMYGSKRDIDFVLDEIIERVWAFRNAPYME